MKFQSAFSFAVFSIMSVALLNPAQALSPAKPILQSDNTRPLQQELSQEQARQAIVKMAGEYKVHFHFAEGYALKPGYQIKPADESSGYETVIVLENTANKVVLQHILVSGDQVVKHWRQDWEYQPKQMWHYVGNYRWQRITLTSEQAQGQWLQTVWQIDDSPRYAALGQWRQDNGRLVWRSEETERPLPRREHTTRQDYDRLIGLNQHVITPTGWVHEQENIKYDQKTQTAIAKEFGLNRYEKIDNYNFEPAYAYWKKHAAYWASVRQAWSLAFEQNEQLALTFPEENKTAHFKYFNDLAKTTALKPRSKKQLDQQTIQLLNQQLILGHVKY